RDARGPVGIDHARRRHHHRTSSDARHQQRRAGDSGVVLKFIVNGASMSTPTEIYSPGLEGVIAGETAISTVTGGLRYRGYPVVELAEHCTFDEVAYLLLYGELPKKKELAEFQKRVAAARQQVPSPLRDLLKALPADT